MYNFLIIIIVLLFSIVYNHIYILKTDPEMSDNITDLETGDLRILFRTTSLCILNSDRYVEMGYHYIVLKKSVKFLYHI